MQKNIIVIVTLLIVFFVNTGCPKPCVEANYSFAVTTQLAPDSDSIRVGDTLYISTVFPNRLTDQATGDLIDYSNANDIESTLSIAQLIQGDSIPKSAVAQFNYVSIFGSVFNSLNIPDPAGVQQLRYQQSGNTYKLKIGLIPLQKGIFALGIGNGLSNNRDNSRACEKAGFNFSISGTNQHIYYFQKWRPNFVLSAVGISKLYCFKVY